MKKILGLDLGTNSIGWAIVSRNEDSTYTLEDKGVHIFQDGVTHTKSGEQPSVQRRTEARSSRRHYFRRRLRKIELLKILVDNKFCPYISREELALWKEKKIYPFSEEFMTWQKSEESSGKNPYYDRYHCLTERLDLSRQEDRYTLGRALYHIVQRRGFKSNRKESTKESEGTVKKSISDLSENMKKENYQYLGEYFFKLYSQGDKIRNSYTSRDEHYRKEFDAICSKQNLSDELKTKLERAIFFQRPLKSQKGSVGLCTFEKNKARCPISHPKYEEFRMWTFINNIKIKVNDDDLRPLNKGEINEILPLFYKKSKSNFNFEEIAKKIAGKGRYSHIEDKDEKPYKFNFKNNVSVSTAPLTAGLISLFGENWEEEICSVYTLSGNKSNDEIINDVWHAMFSFDDDEKLKQWAIDKLQLSEDEAEKFVKINVPQGYAALSLCAIRKILPYLHKGYRYDQAVMLANLRAVTNNLQGREKLKEIEARVVSIMEDNPLEKKKSTHVRVADELRDTYNVDQKHLDKLYHPSMIDLFPKVSADSEGIFKLGSPRTSSIRNPMAMRALFRLRNLVNELLRSQRIDPETEIHIEFARRLNDANKRKAIEAYQREQKKKRNEYREEIKKHFSVDYEPSEDEILKYTLWEEQKHKCLYTGQQIGLSDFLGPNPNFDIEHTVPLSRGGDNSQENKTLCDKRFNRDVKKSKLPSELNNYEEIMRIIEAFKWQEKIDDLDKQIQKTKGYSATKEEKDKKIQKRHLLKMERDYWKNKLHRFTMTEVPEGFSNRQGVDVGIIGRYARLYLKSIFKYVDTIKGQTTADFRKMWGLQDEYEKKDRTNHSHHCMDAITIACIGQNEYRQWIEYCKNEENKNWGAPQNFTLSKPWETFTEDVKKLTDEILVSHYTASNLPKQTKKKLRIRGKVQKNKNNDYIYIQGDTSRVSLHEETFYGAIMQNEELRYVVRKSLASLTNASDVEKIVDNAVKEKVKAAIEAKGFKDAINGTIWMNEELGIPIKKVRLYSRQTPIALKEHRDKSRFEYKRNYYVNNDSNYCMGIYEGRNDKGKTVRSFRIINNLDAVKFYNGKTSNETLLPLQDEKNNDLKCVLKIGTMVLFYQDSPDELKSCDFKELSKRLYEVVGMSDDQNKGTITLRHHLQAENLKDKPRGKWLKDQDLRPFMRVSYTQFNALVEGKKGFRLTIDGQIKFN